MQHDDLQQRSRFIVRAMEWDDPKAKYPNIWVDGMPRLLLAIDRIAGRLRLGDLIATYHPPSQRHIERSDRFVGISRVSGLRRGERPGLAWVELETAFRFDPPLAFGPAPRRVFLCCDPGWPEPEVALFSGVYDAAVTAGWQPGHDERDTAAARRGADGASSKGARSGLATTAAAAARPGAATDATPPAVATEPTAVPPASDPTPPAAPPAPPAAPTDPPSATPTDRPATVTIDPPSAVETTIVADPGPDSRRDEAKHHGADAVERCFAGVDYSGDMRDPRSGTWLAVLGLTGERLEVLRLQAIGRSGLESRLRDPDPLLSRAEAIGLDFPFAFPVPFAERLLGGPFPEEGWWALVRRMERLTRPQFLTHVQEFREVNGALKRLADEHADVGSPLDRTGRDLSPMSFHGVRMIGEDRSRFAVRPFETAQGRLLLEVRPDPLVDVLRKASAGPAAGLGALEGLPVVAGKHARLLTGWGALAAVLAARCAAVAVLGGETDKSADELAPGAGDRVQREGWIYGLDKSWTPDGSGDGASV